MQRSDTWWRTGNTKPMADRQIDQLIGLAQGVLADGIVSQAGSGDAPELAQREPPDRQPLHEPTPRTSRAGARGRVLDEDEGRELRDALMNWDRGRRDRWRGINDGIPSARSRSANRTDCGQHLRLHRNGCIRDPEDDAGRDNPRRRLRRAEHHHADELRGAGNVRHTRVGAPELRPQDRESDGVSRPERNRGSNRARRRLGTSAAALNGQSFALFRVPFAQSSLPFVDISDEFVQRSFAILLALGYVDRELQLVVGQA